MPAELTTMCFHTRDAVDRDDSRMTFRMPSQRLRVPAAKVMLASCEFPITQWTVEEPCNRLWISEGVHLRPGENHIDFVARLVGDATPEVPTRLLLPPRLNRIVGVKRSHGMSVVTLEHPHGLWSERDGAWWPFVPSDARFIGGSAGDVWLTALRLTYVSPTELGVREGDAPRLVDSARLFVPPPRNADELCAQLSAVAPHSADDDVRVRFDYASARDCVVAVVTVTGGQAARVRVLPGPLARRCGLSTTTHRVEGRLEWPSQPTALWGHALLPPGFYGPCHRSYCVGQPLRMTAELELAMNHLYFPLSDSKQHLLVFADPNGRSLTCEIPPGRYTPARLAAHLQAQMDLEVRGSDTHFSVVHEEDRFVFACERRTPAGVVVPARFSLLLHHPLCIDSARLGFDAVPLTNGHTYVAPHRTRAPLVDGRAPINVIRVSEVASQKRFRVHAVPPPPMLGVVVASDGGRATLRTHVNRRPFAHGYNPGDVVKLTRCGDASVEGDGAELRIEECTARLTPMLSCVVAPDPAAPDELVIEVPAVLEVGRGVNVVADAAPLNLHFGKADSLPAHAIGFARDAVLSGRDGSVDDGDGGMAPPFVAPHVHCLDHPDYVLVTFSESGSATLEHSFAGETRPVFCKLSLYPLFREERALPRDTALLKEQLHDFTLQFWNPDFTPYRFHGAEFSFSLAFVGA
jgi:hypothetical protein